MDPEFLKEYSEAEVLLARDLAREDGFIWVDGETASGEGVVDEDDSMTDDQKKRYLELARQQWNDKE